MQNAKFVIQKMTQISNQRKIFYEKYRDKILQQQKGKYINFEELIRT